MIEKIDDVIQQLRDISEQLNDMSMTILSEAIRDGETARPPLEKKVSQARRAVDKAWQLLLRD